MALTISLISQLAQSAVSAAQSNAQLQLKIIGARMTADLNNKLADLQTQATDPTVAPLQNQVSALGTQSTAYSAAQAHLTSNSSAISDIKIQLGSMAFAAANGDGAGFDQALGAAVGDLGILQNVPPLAGFQPDGIAQLQSAGLGIQSSAAYDLSTPDGQAQASSDIQNAQGLIDQIFATTSQNQAIASNIVSALAGQMSAINSQISDRQTDATTAATTAATNLRQQTQTQFHLLELSMGNVQNSSSWLINTEALLANPPTGGLFGLVQSSAAGTNTSFAQALTAAQPATGATSAQSSPAGAVLSILA